ncbi:MAG: LPS export ABC transporter periplasmic protein LptC [Gemmatimonadaceae bacterium]|nr:LPS export ABC transporter periplasmic protein LptC [Gemmatimonadaceae bacterium]
MAPAVRRASWPRAAALVAAAALAACQSDKVSPMAVRGTMADSADQVMFGVRTLVTADGVMQAELFADTAYVFDDNTRYELRGVKTFFHTALGQRNTELTSRAGTYDTRRGTMEARENVLVVSVDGRRLRTEQLTYMQSRNEIGSDSAFVMTEPSGRRLEGVGFNSDPDMRNVRVLKAARGTAGVVEDPASGKSGTPARPRGSTFTLPRSSPP